MAEDDVRWIQRLSHFGKALAQLREAVALADARALSRLEEQGLIQAFEFTHELAWNMLKDFLEAQGAQGLYGFKSVTRSAFKVGLVANGQAWMDMIKSRNLTSHTYNEATAAQIISSVRGEYFPELEALESKMAALTRETRS